MSFTLPMVVGLAMGCWSTEARRSLDEEQVRNAMSGHWTSSVALRNAVVDGDLDEAHARAGELRTLLPAVDGQGALIAAVDAAIASADLEQAAMAVGEMAQACGGCHQTAKPAIRITLAPPPAGNEVTDEMQRHAWAVAMMWSGLVRPSDEDVEAAVAVLRTGQLASDDALLASELETRVHAAAEAVYADPMSRGRHYGELLATCAACHRIYRN